MPLNPNISLAFQPAQIKQAQPQNPLAMAGQVAALQNAQTQNQLAKAKLAQAGKPTPYKSLDEVKKDRDSFFESIHNEGAAMSKAGATPDAIEQAMAPKIKQGFDFMKRKGLNPNATSTYAQIAGTREAGKAFGAAPEKAEAKTQTQKNLEGMGLVRGTPAYQKKMEEKMFPAKDDGTRTAEQASAMADIAIKSNPSLKSIRGSLVSAYRAGEDLGETVRPVTGTTAHDPSTAGKTRTAVLKKTRTGLTNASDLSGRLRGLLVDKEGNPDSTILGLAGGAKKLAHGATAQLNATRKAFVDFASDMGDSSVATEFFNPKIGQAELLTNMLIYANAKANDPQGRVARDDFENEKKAMGASGMLSNAPDVLARLDVLDQIHTKRIRDVEFELNPPQTLSPEDASKLPNGSWFRTTDGQLRQVKK